MNAPHYRNTKKGVKEGFGTSYLLYGHREAEFGCWLIEKDGDQIKTQEILPDWPIFYQPDYLSEACRASALHPMRKSKLGDVAIGARRWQLN